MKYLKKNLWDLFNLWVKMNKRTSPQVDKF